MIRSVSARLFISLSRNITRAWSSQSWPAGIQKFLEKEQIKQPTMIQEKTLSFALQNKDLVGVARTGSGKTLAFVLPAIMKILENKEQSDLPKCLVLAPTRELANQIQSVFDKFRHMNVKSISLVGGSSRSEQIRNLTHTKFDVYVATPGRLMDLIESDIVDLSQIKYLVLDEADRMLDMGFEPQIRTIVNKIPKNRQTLMWSATWPPEIQSLASEFLDNYEYIAVDSENLKANPNIKQIIKVCQANHKLDLLLESLNEFKEEFETPRVLVFVNTKRLADLLLMQLMKNRIKAISMHGDRSQKQRDDALRLFKQRLCNVLVATDVAARGLDISDITHVVNYDFPNTIEDYIHRIGRTARYERSGIAVTLFTENEANLAKKLVKVLDETKQDVPAKLLELAKNQHKYRNEDLFQTGNRRRRQDFYNGSFRYKNQRLSNCDDIGLSNPRYNNQKQWSN